MIDRNWKYASLLEVCEINPGKKDLQGKSKDMEVTFLPMASVSEEGKILVKERRKLKDVIKGYTNFRDGDVLLAKITPCFENGKRTIARDLLNGIGFGSTEFHVLRPKDEVTSDWIFHAISRSDFCNIAKSQMTGTAGQKRVPVRVLEQFQIPIPTRIEQEKIADFIETQFTRLDVAIKSLKAIKNKLRLYRKSVLKAAFNGELIRIGGSWLETTLSAEFEIVMGQSPESKHYNQSREGLPFFQGKKEFTDLYAEVQTWSREATKLAEKDDVLLSIRAPIGPVNLAPTQCGIGRGLAAVKPNAKTSSKLILYLLKSHGVELEKRGTGTTFRAITKPRLYSLPIRIPNNKEDRDRILAEIESRFSVVDKIEEIVDASLAKSEKLRKSILKTAFEGKLVN